MGVPLSHREALVPDELLYASHRRALHRRMRAERVTEDVNARRHLRPMGRVSYPRPAALPCQRRAVVLAQHPPVTEVPVLAERRGQPLGHPDVPDAPILGRRQLTVPVRVPDDDLTPIEIDVGMVNGDACTNTRFIDQLFTPTGLVARCERLLRPGETIEPRLVPDGSERIDTPGGFVLPDNNGGKSVITRLQVFPLPALNLGATGVAGIGINRQSTNLLSSGQQKTISPVGRPSLSR